LARGQALIHGVRDVGGDGCVPVAGDELFPRERVPAFEDAAEVLGVDLDLEPELVGERADPSPRRLAVTEVVVLGRGGDLADVVVGAAGLEATDVQHGPGLVVRFRRRRNLQVFVVLSTVVRDEVERRRASGFDGPVRVGEDGAVVVVVRVKACCGGFDAACGAPPGPSRGRRRTWPSPELPLLSDGSSST
jgi:hypothetical protein